MKTRTFYTTERSPVASDDWRRMDSCYVRGVDISDEFDDSALDNLLQLAEIVNSETEWAKYRIVKITETVEVIFTPHLVTRFGGGLNTGLWTGNY